MDRASIVGEEVHRRLLTALNTNEPYYRISSDDVERQKATIQKLIEKYVMQGRTRLTSRNSYGSRTQLVRKILEEANKPLHYTAIHDQILQMLPPELHYPKERTYASLFYGDCFQLLGNGVFGLDTWNGLSTDHKGEKILQHCPQPLLPETANERAFFESIFVARDFLARQPSLTASQFYAEMQAWTNQSDPSQHTMQQAFDAWYAAGLLDHVDVANGLNLPLKLTLAADAKLNDVRMHCLNALCQRVLKMPELLLTVTRIARPIVSDIQKVLYGGEHAGFDVLARLKILASFEAIQHVDDEWRLTKIGETVLAANPPQELPDFSVIDEVQTEELIVSTGIDELEWELELGLLDL